MRVLILGEGPTDLGRAGPDGTPLREGVLPILVRKLLEGVAPGMPVEVRVQAICRKPRLFPKNSRRMGPSSHGYVNRLRALLGLREGREADAIVIVVDRDGERNADRIVELTKGREQLRQEHKPCAAGVAIEKIEAWLLADEKALCRALDDPTIQRQPDPEKLTAQETSSDHHPKGRLERLMVRALKRDIPTGAFPDHYADIATHLDLRVLEERCPQGFRSFAEQVRELPASI